MASYLYPAISFTARHLDLIDFTYNAGQTALIWKSHVDGKFFKRFEKYRVVMDRIDVFSLFFTGVSLAIEVEKKYKIFETVNRSKIGFKEAVILLTPFAAIGISFSLSLLIVQVANKYFQPSKTPEQEMNISSNAQSSLQMQWNRPEKEQNKQFLLVARAITNSALFCLNTHNPLFLLSALTEVYSLLKLCEQNWVELKKEAEFITKDRYLLNLSEKISISFFSLLLPTKKKEKKCSSCQGLNPDTDFCSKHLFHRACILRHLRDRAESLGQGITTSSRSVIREEIARYSIEVPEDNVCKCPICLQAPIAWELKAHVQDTWLRSAPAIISWV